MNDLDEMVARVLDAAFDLALGTDVNVRVDRREGAAAKSEEQRGRRNHVPIGQPLTPPPRAPGLDTLLAD
jgi:hypothetical protein